MTYVHGNFDLSDNYFPMWNRNCMNCMQLTRAQLIHAWQAVWCVNCPRGLKISFSMLSTLFISPEKIIIILYPKDDDILQALKLSFWCAMAFCQFWWWHGVDINRASKPLCDQLVLKLANIFLWSLPQLECYDKCINMYFSTGTCVHFCCCMWCGLTLVKQDHRQSCQRKFDVKKLF